MRAHVVIGANWGDEGKGLMTDFLARPGGLVVRHNGGAQAGHTVVTPGGQRHVFSHFGSGALRGAGTRLSQFFMVDPIAFDTEREVLLGLDATVITSVDPRALVVTPWDVMLNRIMEEERGGARHGSCGMGINAAMQRHAIIPLTVADLSDHSLFGVLELIREQYLPGWLDGCGVVPSQEWREQMASDAPTKAFLLAAQRFEQNAMVYDDEMVGFGVPLIFEGAQGLMLDQDHPFFPHVTHSRTGTANAATIAAEAGLEGLDVVYVTRAYSTRHGAGPLPGYDPKLRYHDDTNAPNDWQGSIRFGHLNLDLLREAIRADWDAIHETGLVCTGKIALTHLDQVGETLDVILNGLQTTVTTAGLPSLLEEVIGLPVGYLSYGPTCNDVQMCETRAHA